MLRTLAMMTFRLNVSASLQSYDRVIASAAAVVVVVVSVAICCYYLSAEYVNFLSP